MLTTLAKFLGLKDGTGIREFVLLSIIGMVFFNVQALVGAIVLGEWYFKMQEPLLMAMWPTVFLSSVGAFGIKVASMKKEVPVEPAAEEMFD